MIVTTARLARLLPDDSGIGVHDALPVCGSARIEQEEIVAIAALWLEPDKPFLPLKLEKLMLESFKEFIKLRPRIYDFVNRLRPPSGVLEEWLAEFANRHGKLRFVQIGANDGLRWDPLRRFVVDKQWSGVFVEPVPYSYGLLVENYRYLAGQGLAFENVAIATAGESSATIWSVKESVLDGIDLELQLNLLRKASFDRDHLLNTLRNEGFSEDALRAQEVQCMDVNTLFDKHFPDHDIDLVMIDAEGFDCEIVKCIDFGRHKPGVILYETHNSEAKVAEVETLLHNNGYETSSLEGDSLAVLKAN